MIVSTCNILYLFIFLNTVISNWKILSCYILLCPKNILKLRVCVFDSVNKCLPYWRYFTRITEPDLMNDPRNKLQINHFIRVVI